MEKQPYETPRLECIGSVRELTALTSPPCNGSVEFDLAADAICVTEQVDT
ncbi:MAG TPA: lasso RiPP family leader peptide-containing protein [Gemmatimonadota bacterium]|nr:lasso RiPP family leader peptide-containing protein [Gemmatimonadota bacterium]